MNKILKLINFLFLIITFKFDLRHQQKSFEVTAKGNIIRRHSNSSCGIIQLHGTTRNFKEIFFGRCYYYINYHPKIEKKCDFNSSKYNCNEIWQTFYKNTIRYKTNLTDYSELLKMTDMEIPENRSIFWSGTYSHIQYCE